MQQHFGVLIGYNYSRKIIHKATQEWLNENVLREKGDFYDFF